MRGGVLHLDCFSGVSGNMLLGSLLNLGVPAKVVRSALESLGIEDLRMNVSSVTRGPISAAYVSFAGPARSPVERGFASIRALLEPGSADDPVRARALRVFTRLAEAEGRVHGIAPEEVHFHEVGALDAIGDIVGVCAALEHLGASRISASPLPLGQGTVETRHGRLPLPAPATLELLGGIPTYPADVAWETVTPTGAALVAEWVDAFGPMPPLVPRRQGFGAGEDRAGPLPNVLRGVLGSSSPVLEGDVVTVLETNLDDTNPEQLPYLIEELMADGALDVSLSPLSMKKGRPGQLLRVIAQPADRDRLAQRILLESSATGVRLQDMPRLKLARRAAQVDTPFGRIDVKVMQLPDGGRRATPEYEACARASRQYGVALQRVYREAQRAAEDEFE